jgi:hypothetical protein
MLLIDVLCQGVLAFPGVDQVWWAAACCLLHAEQQPQQGVGAAQWL